MKRILKSFILTTVLFTLLSSAYGFSVTRSESQTEMPNVLFIVVDDLKPLLGSYEYSLARTPNIDVIAEKGLVFTHAYCQQAVCAPSRVSVFTGIRPDRTRVWDLKTYMRTENPEVQTLPGYFREQGYETAGLGKLIHGAKNNDPGSWSIPYKHDRELSYAKGFKYPANGKYQDPEIQTEMARARKQKLNWSETNQYLKNLDLAPSTECLDIPDDAYMDGAIAGAGIKMLEKIGPSEKPFFLALGFHKPHLPFAAPKKYWDMYDRDGILTHSYQEAASGSPDFAYHSGMELRNYSDIPLRGPVEIEKQKELIHGYLACVSYVDAQIGKVLRRLEELGLKENTIIVLWGDHGWHLGDHGLWCKHTNFEQATRSPLIISAPGHVEGIRTSSMVELVDIFPTLCELCGLEIPEALEGESLLPILTQEDIRVKDYAISQYPRGNHRMGYSLRTKDYRLTLWFKGPFREKNTAFETNIEAVELYDYQNDPLEKESMAENPAYQSLVDSLKTKLLGLLMIPE